MKKLNYRLDYLVLRQRQLLYYVFLPLVLFLNLHLMVYQRIFELRQLLLRLLGLGLIRPRHQRKLNNYNQRVKQCFLHQNLIFDNQKIFVFVL
jgi:hypothetical protein